MCIRKSYCVANVKPQSTILKVKKGQRCNRRSLTSAKFGTVVFFQKPAANICTHILLPLLLCLWSTRLFSRSLWLSLKMLKSDMRLLQGINHPPWFQGNFVLVKETSLCVIVMDVIISHVFTGLTTEREKKMERRAKKCRGKRWQETTQTQTLLLHYTTLRSMVLSILNFSCVFVHDKKLLQSDMIK